jgi:cobalt-zinc-cadmium efflux system outer membrane protein
VPPEPETYENPTGEVALPDALALALRQNPELKAFAWDLRAAEARGIQARLRPNPELSLEIEELRFERGPGATTTRVGLLSAPIETTLDIPTANGGFSVPIVRRGFTPEWERSGESGAESGLKEAEITLSFSQLIELGGKRARRVQVAQHDREISAWDYEIARADVLAETASAFFAVLAAQERLNLAGQLADLAQQVVDTVSARVEAGKVSPIELSKAEVEHGTIRIDVERARRELDAARSRLASAWGATDAAFARAIGAIESVRPVPTLDALRGRAERSPDIRRWMAEVERRAAEVELERANAWPDVTLTLGLRSTGVGDRTEYSSGFNGPGEFAVSRSRISTGDSREESIVLGASMPLPLFNRNQGRIREAEHLTSKASEERRAAQVQVLSQLAVAYHALDVAYVETQALETQILPKAIEAFEATREGYLEGKFGLLEVLEAERTLFDSQSRLLDSRTAYHQRVIEIERLTGQPLSAGADGDGATEEEP